MQTLLVISREPSLAETLESELSNVSVQAASPSETISLLSKEAWGVILADDETGEFIPLLSNVKASVISLIRPVRLNDLLYTIRQRLQDKSAEKSEYLLSDNYFLYPAERALCAVEGTFRITFTEKEMELLLCLLEGKGRAFGREELLKRVWDYSDNIDTHTLETHISRLRHKLHQAEESFDIVFIEPGGYRLVSSFTNSPQQSKGVS